MTITLKWIAAILAAELALLWYLIFFQVPTNNYFVRAYVGQHDTKFCVIRYVTHGVDRLVFCSTNISDTNLALHLYQRNLQ